MQELINQFDFNGHGVRVITNDQGQIYFVAKDVCDVLGYTNSSKAIKDHCKTEGCTKMVLPNDSLGQGYEQTIINEGNLYRLVLKSKKKEAERFEAWVCDEVLPSIRQTGSYNTKQQIQPQTDLEILSSAVLLAQRVIAEKDDQINKLAPKAEWTDKVLQSDNTYTTTNIAKELGMGAKQLNTLLCKKKIQYWHDGRYVLYANYENEGYTATRTQPFTDSKGVQHTNMYTVWTERGRAFLHYLFNEALSYGKPAKAKKLTQSNPQSNLQIQA